MTDSDNRQIILIVDDEEMNRDFMSSLLADKGYRVVTAVNGRECIEKARSAAPDLIFLDILMPEMDGFETCETLKKDPDLKRIPVVIVTALADAKMRIRGLQSGAIDFLTKPVDPIELTVKAVNLLKIKEYEDALKQQNDRLENTVTSRTADLNAEKEERRLTEYANRKLNEFSRTVLDSMHDALSIIDTKDFRILSVNKQFLKNYGYESGSEVLGRTCYELTHNRQDVCTPPLDACPLQETVETGQYVLATHHHCDSAGKIRHIEIETTPIRDETGEIRMVIHVERDITRRKADEEELVRKHDKLQTLFEQVALIKKEWELSMDCTKDMILMIDDIGRIKRCNRTMRDFTGLQYTDILQRHWREFLNSFGLSADRLAEEPLEQSAELYHQQSRQWFALNSYPYDDKEIGLTGTVLTLHDVTQLKNMTEALEITNRVVEENREKLQDALDQLSNLIEQVTLKKDFSIRFSNPNLRKCREVMNCSRKECLCYEGEATRCWQEAGTFCGGKVQGQFIEKFGSCAECPTFKYATEDPIYQIGENFNNMMHILALQHNELEQAYNDLKIAQSQITQQEKMASIGQLAAGVAHEINNPTGFIMSNLGSLQKYADRLTEFIRIQSEALANLPSEDAETVEKQRKSLKVDYIIDDLRNLVKESLDGADRIKKIVQDLKSFSRVDEAELKMADINIGIESTINIVWNELKYKATVKKEYGDIPQIRCNPGQLNQVFMNILMNAAHAIEKQGEIGIRTWAENDMLKVLISDTGSGIPKDKLNRIFEPFYTTKEVGKGTGLGLSIAYDIVKKHKGSIEVESEAGKGTTFVITIPITQETIGKQH